MEKIPFEEARKLCTDPHSGFTLISGEQHISLPPKYLGHIGQGVRQQLDAKIGFFSEKFSGALIAYSNIKLLSDKGKILGDAPYIHFKIQADFVLFKPCVGSCLTGLVNKVGKDHIGLLVHSHFNVSVPLIHSGRQEEVTVAKGDLCRFTVTHLHMHRNLLSMRGKNIQGSDFANSYSED